MTDSLADILNRLDIEIRDKHGAIQAAEIKLGALRSAYADLMARAEEAKTYLARAEPVYENIKRKMEELANS
jgi:hypothetical protein